MFYRTEMYMFCINKQTNKQTEKVNKCENVKFGGQYTVRKHDTIMDILCSTFLFGSRQIDQDILQTKIILYLVTPTIVHVPQKSTVHTRYENKFGYISL